MPISLRQDAKVLEQMDNADVTAILGGVSDKRAAEILALFPAARAAELSKTALRPRGDTK